MHEQSLVRALLSQVREACEPYPAAQVNEIVVAIGRLAGVEPLLIETAFELLTSETDLRSSRLVVETTPLKLACQSCGNEFETEELTFSCSRCSSLNTRVIGGDQFVLRRVVLSEQSQETLS